MKKKSLLFNSLKPQNYYFRLFIFFTIVSFTLTLFLFKFETYFLDLFLLKFIIIFFLLMLIAVLVEYFHLGEYMFPIESYEVEIFFKNFLDKLKENSFEENSFEEFFNRFDLKTKKKIKQFTKKRNKIYFISSIRKIKNKYEIVFINELTLFRYFFFKFFIKSGIHKAYMKKINDELKIIKIN